MRVVAGTSRGRVLKAPRGGDIRPTADKVREAIFDVLGGVVELTGATVADLFAGSGAMGIEALSRGAASVVFVDHSPVALRAVRQNLTAAGLDDAPTRIVRAEALRWLARPHAFDLALCDPPYAFDAWHELLGRLRAAVAVLETDRPVDTPPTWEVIKRKRYGGTLVSVVRAVEPLQRGTS
ncbi:MAG TPA: RsmD family RNA methyltransferase [Acidimicrobiales bacterium]|nr:RsmD family RNA methyltransferase [Acidimicrobiales bacterium]